MPVTDFLERNVKLYGDETALVELNPEMKDDLEGIRSDPAHHR